MSKEITLTKGMKALVDDEDYDLINSLKWGASKSFQTHYARRRPSKKLPLACMHHMLIGKPPEGMVTDHIDGNGLNNTRHNLRHVSHRVNCQNRHYQKTSKYPGVSWSKQKNKWRSRMTKGKDEFHLGHFISEEDAYCAYSISSSFFDILLGAGLAGLAALRRK